jgi:hypothetical protein
MKATALRLTPLMKIETASEKEVRTPLPTFATIVVA